MLNFYKYYYSLRQNNIFLHEFLLTKRLFQDVVLKSLSKREATQHYLCLLNDISYRFRILGHR